MKEALSIVLFLLFSCSCFPQQVIPRYHAEDYGSVSGVYYKDTNNDYNRFEGTWLYTNGNTSLKIILQKKEMQPNIDDYASFYEDLVVGEYRYVENGIEKINTLPNLQVNYPDPYDYNIKGGIIMKPSTNVPEACLGCGPNDIKIKVVFSDPTRTLYGYEPYMFFHHYVENGVEKLKLTFISMGTPLNGPNGEENQYSQYTIPFGEYILIKQP